MENSKKHEVEIVTFTTPCGRYTIEVEIDYSNSSIQGIWSENESSDYEE
jgi:hypothetical protein